MPVKETMPISWHLQMINIEKTRTQIWPSVQLMLSSHWTVPIHHIWKQHQQSEKNRGKTLNISDIELTHSRWVTMILLKAERFSVPSYEYSWKTTLRSNPASKPHFSDLIPSLTSCFPSGSLPVFLNVHFAPNLLQFTHQKCPETDCSPHRK